MGRWLIFEITKIAPVNSVFLESHLPIIRSWLKRRKYTWEKPYDLKVILNGHVITTFILHESVIPINYKAWKGMCEISCMTILQINKKQKPPYIPHLQRFVERHHSPKLWWNWVLPTLCGQATNIGETMPRGRTKLL